jgi:hypothetical protein
MLRTSAPYAECSPCKRTHERGEIGFLAAKTQAEYGPDHIHQRLVRGTRSNASIKSDEPDATGMLRLERFDSRPSYMVLRTCIIELLGESYRAIQQSSIALFPVQRHLCNPSDVR